MRRRACDWRLTPEELAVRDREAFIWNLPRYKSAANVQKKMRQLGEPALGDPALMKYHAYASAKLFFRVNAAMQLKNATNLEPGTLLLGAYAWYRLSPNRILRRSLDRAVAAGIAPAFMSELMRMTVGWGTMLRFLDYYPELGTFAVDDFVATLAELQTGVVNYHNGNMELTVYAAQDEPLLAGLELHVLATSVGVYRPLTPATSTMGYFDAKGEKVHTSHYPFPFPESGLGEGVRDRVTTYLRHQRLQALLSL